MSLKLPPSRLANSASQSYHGRRLMQMFFRAHASNNDERDQEEASDMDRQCGGNDVDRKKPELMDPRAEVDGEAARASQLNGVVLARAQLPVPSAPPGEFHSLKRKLLPSRMRTTHLIRTPPLITSPISVSSAPAAATADEALRSNNNNHSQQLSLVFEPQISGEDELQIGKGVHTYEPRSEACHDPTFASCRANIQQRSAVNDDDDLELEIAIENRVVGIEQDTLDEEQETEASEEQLASRQLAEDEPQALENEYEATLPKTTLGDDEVARVEQALLESNRLESGAVEASFASGGGGGGGLFNSQTTRLRSEIFDLDVRDLSPSIQASLLLELEEAENELAFAADLDSVLAQFSGEEQVQAARSSSSDSQDVAAVGDG